MLQRKPTLSEELALAAHRAFREFVPVQQDRKPLSWGTFGLSLSWLAPYLFMAYLVRRADTQLIRLLLLPTVIGMTLRCTYSYIISSPNYMILEWIRTSIPLAFITFTIDFASTHEGRLKIHEKKLHPLGSVPVSSTAVRTNVGGGSVQGVRTGFLACLPPSIADALEVGFAIRGLGWDFGRDMYFPQSRRPQGRGAFLRATATSFLLNLLMVDLGNSLAKSVPGVGDPTGGSIYLTYLPTLIRYAMSTGMHIFVGIIIQSVLSLGYDLFTLIGVGIMKHPPSDWPPIFDNPWASESLHELWGKSWHQLLRRTFLVCGGYPGFWIGGNVGLIMGSFLASGLFHQIGLNIWDKRPLLFFMLQGLGILLENVWKRLTGRRVGGVFGRLWVYLDMFALGQIATDAWCAHGMAGALLIPHKWSPCMRLFGPAFESLRHNIESYGIGDTSR